MPAATRHLAVALLTCTLTALGPTPVGAVEVDGRAVAVKAGTGNHFIGNRDGSKAPADLGFTIFDTNPSRRQVKALPDGVRALVYLEQKCPTRANDKFRATVRRLADLKKVYGYYLSDEPHVADCPKGPERLATRTKFIRRATEGRQKSFIVLSQRPDYKAFRPKVTGVNLVGLNPYPCSTAHPECEIGKINEDVGAARKRGIPLRKIVPVYQAFGQENTADPYYLMPTADQLRALLARWAEVVPSPKFDYTYTWGNQGSADPTLVDAPELQSVFVDFFSS